MPTIFRFNPTLLYLFLSVIGASLHAFDSDKLFLPSTFGESYLSPDGKWLCTRLKLHSKAKAGFPISISRLTVASVESLENNLIGPAMRDDDQPDSDHSITDWRWATDGTIIAATSKRWIRWNPDSREELESYPIPPTIQSKKILALNDDPEIPIIVASNTFQNRREYSSLWSWIPASGKMARITESRENNRDFLAMSQANGTEYLVFPYRESEAASGLQIQRDGTLLERNFHLPKGLVPVWAESPRATLPAGMIFASPDRYGSISTLRIYDWINDRLLPVSIRLPWENSVEVLAYATRTRVLPFMDEDRLIDLDEGSFPGAVELKNKTQIKYPGANFSYEPAEANPGVVLFSFNASNLPNSRFVFETNPPHLRFAHATKPSIPNEALVPSIIFDVEWAAHSNKGTLTKAAVEGGKKGFVLYIQTENNLRYQGSGFNRMTQFLSQEGFDVLCLYIPFDYVAKSVSARSAEDLRPLIAAFRSDVAAVLEKLTPTLLEAGTSQDKLSIWAEEIAVPFAVALPEWKSRRWSKLIAINPLFATRMEPDDVQNFLIKHHSNIKSSMSDWQQILEELARERTIGDAYVGVWQFSYGTMNEPGENGRLLKKALQKGKRKVEDHIITSSRFVFADKYTYERGAAIEGVDFLLEQKPREKMP